MAPAPRLTNVLYRGVVEQFGESQYAVHKTENCQLGHDDVRGSRRGEGVTALAHELGVALR